MRFEPVPILAMAREIYQSPRGMARFREYLATMKGASATDIDYPPLVAMNPMGREHVVAAIDRLLAMGAERLLAEAMKEAEARFREPEGSLKVGLTLLDDLAGGWTHSELSEAAIYFEPTASLKRGWVVVPTWTKRLPEPADVRAEALAAAARAAWQLEKGAPRSLREAMAQEGAAWRFAGRRPTLDAASLDAARRALAPHLDDTRFATLFAGMYGDRAAAEAGHRPLGVPERAGFEVAIA